MEKILEVNGLKKTFKLSAKQQKIEKTNEKVKVRQPERTGIIR